MTVSAFRTGVGLGVFACLLGAGALFLDDRRGTTQVVSPPPPLVEQSLSSSSSTTHLQDPARRAAVEASRTAIEESPQAPSRPPSELTATIEVRAVDATTGLPLGEVHLIASTWSVFESDEAGTLRRTTDIDGVARIKVPLGFVEILAYQQDESGQRLATASTRLVDPGARELLIELQPAAALTGLVICDSTGVPIPGARVSNHVAEAFGAPTLTDADGTFVLCPWLTEVEAGVVVTADGFAQESARIRVSRDGSWSAPARFGMQEESGENGPHLCFRLRPERSIIGSLTDSAGKEVSGGWARASGTLLISKNFGRADRQESKTDARGRFRLEGLSAEVTHTIWVGANGLTPRRFVVGPGSARVDVGSITLEPASSVGGRVLDAAGFPIGGLAVSAGTARESGVGIDADPRGGANQVRDGFSRPETHTVETSTDTDGHFILADLPAGELLLRIESAGSRLVDQRIHLAAGQRRELLPSALVIDDHRTSLSGTVSALAPQPEELSLLLHEPGHGLVSTTSPDPSGAFRIWGLRRDADYALEVRSADAVLWRGAVTLDDAPLAIR